ncbi:hypothetical protein SASPL_112274 [Salvia splendens]|uniref:chlorophyllase n=1 Tax=Salvia splendens TaxID=180675 RepID=A0A8X8YE11_SALSN|nr:chlorophyllase-2 [Salvia splendens]KAG6428026.1 hypothetical protein SASPL_112274 [Salvia splendens]
MSPSTSIPSTNVFEIGNYTTTLIRAEPSVCNRNKNSNTPPKPVLICSPIEEGVFPVLLFLHGYLLYNSFYSLLLQHIASHGFIVVAPQLYLIAGSDSNGEIKTSAEITNWLALGLGQLLPPNVKADLGKLGLAGHSRGGKVAFALALRKSTSLKFSALIGIDPVDGSDVGKQTPPPVLTYVPHSFDLDGTAVLVVGAGLGEVRRNPLFPPCAPKGVNHQDFYSECCKPAYYCVAKDYGHLDMLDDDTNGIRGRSTYCLCKNGESRGPMRIFVGGILVAFLKAYLEDDEKELVAIREGYDEMVPIQLQAFEFQV